MNSNPEPPGKARYRWPWVALAAAITAVLLAVLWMSREVERTKRIRDANIPSPMTSTSSPAASP